MRRLLTATTLIAFGIGLAASCRNGGADVSTSGPSSLNEVPAVRLNYRYEADVPAPEAAKSATTEERIAAVQSDFDQNRTQEILDKTITSPDRKRVLAVYHRPTDAPAEFRLDMYTADGKILKRVSSDLMAIHFPDTIRWSPDSSSAAFVAMVRVASADSQIAPPPMPNTNTGDANSAETDTNAETVPAATPPPAPTGILAFRTEQIYVCGADGDAVKPITQNEGLIYFYYVWAPDSSGLAALAATTREWQFLNQQADSKGEVFIPMGRPRLVEKNGRERRLDDALTAVQPVWSPDSSKIAAAFFNPIQIRIYDAAGTTPTQAAIPLRNNLLLSSSAYDREQQAKLGAANTQTDINAVANSQTNTNQAPTTLPDESSLVSFNPIVTLNWVSDDLLYFQTAFVKRMKNEADSVTSFPRWHRLVLSPQPTTTK